VTTPPIPQISWPESADPAAEQRVVGRICTLLAASLPPLAPGQARLLFALPTPAPYDAAHAALLAGLPAGMQIRSLTWRPHGRCYLAEGLTVWPELVPRMFRLGPPELTFLAVQGPCRIGAPAATLLQAMRLTLADQRCPDVAAHAGLHFDSGDLRERF